MKQLKTKFRKYLWDNNLTISDFADKCGYSRIYIQRLINEPLTPSLRCARQLSDATGGQISVSDFLDGTFKHPILGKVKMNELIEFVMNFLLLYGILGSSEYKNPRSTNNRGKNKMYSK